MSKKIEKVFFASIKKVSFVKKEITSAEVRHNFALFEWVQAQLWMKLMSEFETISSLLHNFEPFCDEREWKLFKYLKI